jgi:hypothetical protein
MVAELFDPEWTIEIEAVAAVETQSGPRESAGSTVFDQFGAALPADGKNLVDLSDARGRSTSPR